MTISSLIKGSIVKPCRNSDTIESPHGPVRLVSQAGQRCDWAKKLVAHSTGTVHPKPFDGGEIRQLKERYRDGEKIP